MKKYKVELKQYDVEFEVKASVKFELIRETETEVREHCTKHYKGYEITSLEVVKDSNGLDIWYPYNYITEAYTPKVYTPTSKGDTTQDIIDQLAKAGISACTIEDYLSINRINTDFSIDNLKYLETKAVREENYEEAAVFRDQIKALDEVTD